MQLNVAEEFARLVEESRGVVKSGGDVMNSLTFLRSGAPIMSLRFTYGVAEKKAIANEKFGMLAALLQAEVVIVVLDTMVAAFKEETPFLAPIDDPRSVDALIALAIDTDGLIAAKLYPYVFGDDGAVSWKHEATVSGIAAAQTIAGQFLDLLQAGIMTPVWLTSHLLRGRTLMDLLQEATAALGNPIIAVLRSDESVE